MILVTGGTGFLGKFILEELSKQGEKVRVLARNPEKARSLPPGAELAEGDILDIMSLERAMEGVDYVIHSAALVSFWKKERPKMREINVTGTANVVNLALELGVKKLVHVSSVAALGRVSNGATVTEESKWKENHFSLYYGKTKYQAEKEVYRGIAEGLNAVICNPGVIMGPGVNWNEGTPRMFRTIKKGLKWYNPGTTGLVPAVDVARAIYLLLKSDFAEGEKFILVSDSLPYKELFGMVAESVGAKPPYKELPKFLAMLIGKAMEIRAGITGKPPAVSPETMRLSRGKFIYDGSKITRKLDFQYSSLKDVIRETGRRFLEENGNSAQRK